MMFLSELPRAASTYKVTVYYREPSFELRHGPRPQPFRWVFALAASDANDARSFAAQEFTRLAHLSSVSWVRQIVRIDVEVGEAA